MSQETLEVWEMTIPGRVTVTVSGEYGRPRDITALGQGQRLRIGTRDRRISQEVIRLKENDPFRNGMLFQVNRETLDRERAESGTESEGRDGDLLPDDNELTDDQLSEVFGLSVEDGTFAGTVQSLTEVNVRRLISLIPKVDAKGSQITFLNEYIREAYPIGGDTPTYREMQQTPASAV